MTERFDDVATVLAGNDVNRRSMVRGVLAALGFGAGAIAIRQQPAAAAPKTTCPPGLTPCGNLCRDLSSDSSNCGACGTVCANDAVCRNETCVKVSCRCDPTCPTGLTWCGACVNTATDPAHCGSCTSACSGSQVCSNGTCVASCVPKTCQQLGIQCGTVGDGCGGTLTCGTCTSPATCTNGVCAPPPQCVSASDCPGTDSACQSRTCTNGVCGSAPRPAGTACPGGTCDGQGQCNQQCPTGFVLCNGVCVDTSTSLANCGTCGHQCANPPNGTATCVSGTCGVTCNAGFADCNGNPADGCETNLNTSTTNCGACGRTCPANTVCTNGTCTCTPATCQQLGISCGTASDGCGGTINCGTCASPATCTNGRCIQPTCLTASDCPGTDTACQTRTCANGTCGIRFAPPGTLCPTGTCNGGGQCV